MNCSVRPLPHSKNGKCFSRKQALGTGPGGLEPSVKATDSPSHLQAVGKDGIGLAHDFQQRVWSIIHEEICHMQSPSIWTPSKKIQEIPCDWDVLSLSSSCPTGRCISPHLARIGWRLRGARESRKGRFGNAEVWRSYYKASKDGDGT